MSIDEPTARWIVPLNDGNHVVEFEHGTATGKRVVKIDGQIIINREWMFRLVGDEDITFHDTKFTIRVDPVPGNFNLLFIFKRYLLFYNLLCVNIAQIVLIDVFMGLIVGLKYSYTLWVNGKTFKSFIQSQSKVLESWVTNIKEKKYRIVLDKAAQTVWINGKQIDVEV